MSHGLVAGLCLLLCAACATAEPPSILEQTETQLRADIEQSYRALQRQHQIKPLHSGLLYSVSVAVVLEPPGPDDYSVLRRANGSLHTVIP